MNTLQNYARLRALALEGKARARSMGSMSLAEYYQGQIDILDQLLKELAEDNSVTKCACFGTERGNSG